MARPKREDDTVTVTVRLNADVVEGVRKRFFDSFTGKVKYGAINAYIEMLVLQDMKAYNAIMGLVDNQEEKTNG